MEIFLQTQTWVSLLSLTAIEVIMGIDNLVFIAIVTGKLPVSQQKLARRLGLIMAMLMRLLLLAVIVWLSDSTKPFMYIGSFSISIRTLVLFCGGIFLLIKAGHELWETGKPEVINGKKKTRQFFLVIAQIMVLDILFSLDSVITAVGIVKEYTIMAMAIIIAVLTMIAASEPVSHFIMGNPRVKILALCILLLVGIKLTLAGLHVEMPSAYLFIAMGFALFVELMNICLPVLHKKYHANNSNHN
jgi:predicted tellurium resistance membrane protein TerC